MIVQVPNPIALHNDQFRKMGDPSCVPGRIFVTRAVSALPDHKLIQLMGLVRTFDQFTEDNDPYGEHDFGRVVLDSQAYFWKIDYYADETCEYGSADPSNLRQTFRVLTIMRSDEY